MTMIKNNLIKIGKLFSLKSDSLDIDKLFKEGIIIINNKLNDIDFELLTLISNSMFIEKIIIFNGDKKNIELVLNNIKSKKYIIDDKLVYKYIKSDNYIEYGDSNKKTKENDIELFKIFYDFRKTINIIKEKYEDIILKYDNIEFVYCDKLDENNLNDYNKRTISSTNLKEKDIILDMIINEVKSYNMSPFENYLYLYSVVKMFKFYKCESDEESPYLSRKNEFTLFNNYMVCAGYSDLLVELIDTLNDPNLKASQYMCLMGNKKDDAHVRCLIKINDDKYNINGFYISDPTEDAIKSKDLGNYYNHILLTKEEIDKMDFDKNISDCTDVLFSNHSKKNNISNLSWSIAHYINWKMNLKFLPIESCKLNSKINLPQEKVHRNKIIRCIRTIYAKLYLPKSKEFIIGMIRNQNKYNNFVNDIIKENQVLEDEIAFILKNK